MKVFLGIPDTERMRELRSITSPEINAGKSAPIRIAYMFAEKDFGRRILSVEVDVERKIEETDENNNQHTFADFWVAPDPNRKPPEGQVTLGVLNFFNRTNKKDFEDFSFSIPEMLTEELRKVENLKLVERQHLEHLVNELKLQEENPEDIQKLGKLVGAQALCLGSFIDPTGFFRGDPFDPAGRWHFHARIDVVETGVIVEAQGVTNTKAEMFKMIKDLAEQITTNLEKKLQLEVTRADRGKIQMKDNVYSAKALHLFQMAKADIKAGRTEDAKQNKPCKIARALRMLPQRL